MIPQTEIRVYQTLTGKRPFEDWLHRLKDKTIP